MHDTSNAQNAHEMRCIDHAFIHCSVMTAVRDLLTLSYLLTLRNLLTLSDLPILCDVTQGQQVDLLTLCDNNILLANPV